MSNTVAKSFENSDDPIINYCCGLTVIQHPLQKELQKETLDKAELAMMLGAPEILTIGSHFLELIGGKKVIDIGTYTGASALAWALAIPDGGKVCTLDVDHKNFKKHGLPILKKCAKTMEKIEAVEAPALETLARLLADGEKGTFDFAFIDADKPNYTNYYNRCVELLRPGGVILVDNSLWSGKVVNYDPEDVQTKAIDECNKAIFADPRTRSFLVNCGDGLHVAFKRNIPDPNQHYI